MFWLVNQDLRWFCVLIFSRFRAGVPFAFFAVWHGGRKKQNGKAGLRDYVAENLILPDIL
jgi:hypothetical protein